MGTYTDIVSIAIQASASAGEVVPATIRIKNIYSQGFTIMAVVIIDGVYFTRDNEVEYYVAPGATQSYLGHFTMPNKNVVFTAKSYYISGGIYYQDDELAYTITLEVVEWVQLAVATVSVAAVAEWVQLAVATVSVNAIAEWVSVAVATVSVTTGGAAGCTPGDTKCIGSDLYQCSPGGEWALLEENSDQCPVNGEEEKEFPWLIVAGGLGLAAVGVAVATKKKKKP